MNRKNPSVYENQRFGQERALYGMQNVLVRDCAFDGDEDGESALKEARSVTVENTLCNLRYPFWHDTDLTVSGCQLTDRRAALWYSQNVTVEKSELHGIKALRECNNVTITDSSIRSAEFGWSSSNLNFHRCTAEGEYFLLRAARVSAQDLQMKGKYSFQYVENAVFENCVFDTKDAFWHAKNITVKNCTVKGEYLAWYSENITFIHCKISGTQPFCYCKQLRLIDCELTEADLCFERSEVEATLLSPVISIKNPYAGTIVLPQLNELILDDPNAKATVTVTDTDPKSNSTAM